MQEYEFYVARVDGFDEHGEHFTNFVGKSKRVQHLDRAWQFAGFDSAKNGVIHLLNELADINAKHLTGDVIHFKCQGSAINIAE